MYIYVCMYVCMYIYVYICARGRGTVARAPLWRCVGVNPNPIYIYISIIDRSIHTSG